MGVSKPGKHQEDVEITCFDIGNSYGQVLQAHLL